MFTGAPDIMYIDRPREGLYVIIVTLMLFVPVAFRGFLFGWISDRRSVALAILLAFLFVLPGLMLALWDFPSSSLDGWDVPSDESATSLLTLYLAYLTIFIQRWYSSGGVPRKPHSESRFSAFLAAQRVHGHTVPTPRSTSPLTHSVPGRRGILLSWAGLRVAARPC